MMMIHVAVRAVQQREYSLRINGRSKAKSDFLFAAPSFHLTHQPKLMCGLCLCVTRHSRLIFKSHSFVTYAIHKCLKKIFAKCEKLIPDFITYDGMAIQSVPIMKMVGKAILLSFVAYRSRTHVKRGRPYKMTKIATNKK